MNISQLFTGSNAVGVARRTEEERLADKAVKDQQTADALAAQNTESAARTGQYNATAENLKEETASQVLLRPIKILAETEALNHAKLLNLADMMNTENKSADQMVLNASSNGNPLTNEDPRLVDMNKNREKIMKGLNLTYVPYDVAANGMHDATAQDLQTLSQLYSSTLLTYPLQGGASPENARKIFADLVKAMKINISTTQMAAMDKLVDVNFKTQIPTITADISKFINDPNNTTHLTYDKKTGFMTQPSIDAMMATIDARWGSQVPPELFKSIADGTRTTLKVMQALTPAEKETVLANAIQAAETARSNKAREKFDYTSLASTEKQGALNRAADLRNTQMQVSARSSGGGGGGPRPMTEYQLMRRQDALMSTVPTIMTNLGKFAKDGNVGGLMGTIQGYVDKTISADSPYHKIALTATDYAMNAFGSGTMKPDATDKFVMTISSKNVGYYHKQIVGDMIAAKMTLDDMRIIDKEYFQKPLQAMGVKTPFYSTDLIYQMIQRESGKPHPVTALEKITKVLGRGAYTPIPKRKK